MIPYHTVSGGLSEGRGMEEASWIDSTLFRKSKGTYVKLKAFVKLSAQLYEVPFLLDVPTISRNLCS